jgi:acetyl-CoA carboxylase carboxyltransferase component
MKIELESNLDEDVAKALQTVLTQYLGKHVELGLPDGKDVTSGGEPVWEFDKSNLTEREKDLRDQISTIMQGGGESGHEKIKKIGKLFVRDRLNLIFDEIEYEDGTFANFSADDNLPADGVICGVGRIDGKKVFFTAHDYTVKAGSIGEQGMIKINRISERAAEARAPILRLIDSTGGRIDTWIDEGDTHADLGGKLFYNQCIHSGQIPQIGVLYGPCIAGAAYEPIFCDYLIMVDEISGMAIASPRIIEQMIGESINMEELGGPSVHSQITGSADLVVSDENEAAEKVRQLINYLPQDCDSPLPIKPSKTPSKNPYELDHVIPENDKKRYDVREAIDHIVDMNSFLELKPEFGKEIVTGFGRLDGKPVGIIANQPAHNAGAIYPDTAEKSADFIWKCDAFGIPLLYLVDTPGFMVGSKVEHDAILQKGRRFIFATSNAEVPQIAVLLRKSYAAGTYAMASPAFEPDVQLALPSAKFALMGPEAAVRALFAPKIDAIDDPGEREKYIAEKQEEFKSDIVNQASNMHVDEIIPPSELRDQVIKRFETLENKRRITRDRHHSSILF